MDLSMPARSMAAAAGRARAAATAASRGLSLMGDSGWAAKGLILFDPAGPGFTECHGIIFIRMRILLSNDDGYFAPGLAALAEGLAPLGEITVVAPERDRSGASNSLTLDRPLQLAKAHNGFLYVNGTPTDCVHMAVTGLLDFDPDIIVSGINSGANMGDDTLYSGTVAAATEGYLLGIPAIAVSLVSREFKHYATAARVARDMVERAAREPFGTPVLLNVNVPDLPYEELQGTEVTRLGRRHKAQPV